MIAAIVLAAGASTRMGQPKAALPLGARGGTVLSCGVSSLLAAGVPRVVVVAGAHLEAVRQALRAGPPSVTIVHHPGWQDGQLSSMLCGLDALDHPMLEAVLMTLVDVPLVAPDDHAAADARLARPRRRDRSSRQGRDPRASRALRPPGLRRAPRRRSRAHGAKPVVRAHAHDLLNVPVTDDGAFLDLDTPEDYARALSIADCQLPIGRFNG